MPLLELLLSAQNTSLRLLGVKALQQAILLTIGHTHALVHSFTETTLQPGETLEAPVVFYIDPEIELNRELASLKSITLSYTYFPSKNGQPVAESKGDGNQSKL